MSSQPASAENQIQCYFCYNPTDVHSCNLIKTCPVNYTFCRTVKLSPNMGFPYTSSTFMVTRDCVENCQNSDMGELGSEAEVYCCKGNLCNNQYGVVPPCANHQGASTYHLQSRAYGGLIVGFSLFIVLFPSWVW
ncbi:secreted Ly-6/uPAR-related protein 1-like [Lithobates pipiens]